MAIAQLPAMSPLSGPSPSCAEAGSESDASQQQTSLVAQQLRQQQLKRQVLAAERRAHARDSSVERSLSPSRAGSMQLVRRASERWSNRPEEEVHLKPANLTGRCYAGRSAAAAADLESLVHCLGCCSTFVTLHQAVSC